MNTCAYSIRYYAKEDDDEDEDLNRDDDWNFVVRLFLFPVYLLYGNR